MTDPEAALRETLSDEALTGALKRAERYANGCAMEVDAKSAPDEYTRAFNAALRDDLVDLLTIETSFLTPRAWQPMETPMDVPLEDMRAFLVFCPSNECQYMVYRFEGALFTWSSVRDVLDRHATHWRPLPPAPKERQG